ncbi:hypothetical protein ACI48J_22490 [Paenibacillus chitinolyticus]|uniref:hypothetical protein n=1 Tax=Paenibacillus chitinolyticus TaxID=79263 RepID=UPI0038680315
MEISKKTVTTAILSLSLLSVSAIPAMAADHLTPSDNPAKPEHRANAQADILNGNALPAKHFVPNSFTNTLIPAGDPDHTQIYEFTFSGVSGTGIDSKKFYSSGVTLEIDSFAERSSGSDGNYQITLYKKGPIFNKNLGTKTYKHSYAGTWGSGVWSGDGSGDYFFWLGSEVYQQLISGRGVVYDIN